MNIYALPVFGWTIGLLLHVSMALVFWFFWTACGVGEDWFDFLPVKYQSPSLWAIIGMFICLSILKSVIVPTLSSSESNAKVTKKAS
ncbi:MAG: hypothetical protein V1792_23395 [Pseudomonadota bacterium]